MIHEQHLATDYMERYSINRDGGMPHYDARRDALEAMNGLLAANQVPTQVAQRLKASAMRIVAKAIEDNQFMTK